MSFATLDLSLLHDITHGDIAIEREFFRMFLDSSKTCMKRLSASVIPGREREWESAAHAFKGISHGLGALRLGELCRQAMEGAHAVSTSKEHMLRAIGEELASVEQQLEILKDSSRQNLSF